MRYRRLWHRVGTKPSIQRWQPPWFASDMFKDSFKYYKSRESPPDLRNVLDFQKPDFSKVTSIAPCTKQLDFCLGLKDTDEWKIYELKDKPGLIFIPNPFTPEGQRYWIAKCVKDYTKKPNKLNLDAHDFLNENEDWWTVCCNDVKRCESLLPKLRWATMGYHHNWDTKRYSDHSKNEMPPEVANLAESLAAVSGFSGFKAEAAIVNYYRMTSTLSGHTDHSEMNKEAPLLSISFGQTGIFLIGGRYKEDPATAMYLRSGDVIIMAAGSRLRYHGVPRIVPADNTPWEPEVGPEAAYIRESRINMNVRQVLKTGENSLDGEIF